MTGIEDRRSDAKVRFSGPMALVALLGMGLIGACGDSKDVEPRVSDLLTGGVVTLAIPLPPGTAMSSVVLASSSTMLLGSNVRVAEEGLVTGHPTIANTGTGTMSTQTGVNDLTADLWSIGSVSLATSTNVAGAVTTGGTLTTQTGVTIGGPVLQRQSLTPVSTTISLTFPSSSTNVLLNPSQNGAIAPGAYATVTVNANATLTLQSGTYYFDSVDVEPQGKISLTGAGPFVLNVRSSLTMKGQLLVPATSPPPTVVVVDAGTADVFLQAEFDGTLIAPKANITLAAIGTASYHGAFFGKSLTLQAGVKIVHRSTTLGSASPIAECIITQTPGSYQAVFGYTASSLLSSVTIPFGPDNSFSPAPATRNQPQVFNAGRHTAQFAVPFNGTALTWQLDGRSSTATALLPECTTACVQHLATPAMPRIDTVLPTAAVPMSIDESIVQRDAFRWDDTLPVPETFSDGTPRLYYGLMYVDSSSVVDAMDAMRIHYDNIPLFDQEIQSLQSNSAPISYPMDGRGQFEFGLIPGAAYNALRTAALDPTQPTEIFRALQLRSIPPTDSTLSTQSSCGLTPVATCVAHASNGTLRAVFSYNNPAGGPVTVPVGPDNAVTGGPAGTVAPEAFATGVHTAVFVVNMAAGATISWQLAGQTVLLNAQAPTCSAAIVNQIGVDQYNPFPSAATPTCRSATPTEAQYPNSHLPPAARVNTCASVSYSYAGTLGFLWRGVASDADDTRGQAADALLALADTLPAGTPAALTVPASSATNGGVEVVRSALFGKLFRKVVQAVAGTVKTAVDDVRRGLTTVAGLFVGSTQVTVTASALNTDPFLNPGGTPTPVLQAWGANFGKPISLQGIQARAKKSLFLSVGGLDSNNKATVKVLNGLGASICFNLSNGAAKVVDGWFLPITVCPSGSSAHIGGSPPNAQTVTISDGNMNIMAQMTDTHLYMANVAKASISQAEALVGTVPNLIGKLNQNRAFTPCFSFSWANDVGTLLGAIGAVAADHLDTYLVSKIESEAKSVANGMSSLVVPEITSALSEVNAVASQLVGTNLAADASAAVGALQGAVNQAQAAAVQATLLAQDAADFTDTTGMAARLESAASSRANAAANMVQSAATNLTGGVPILNTGIQSAVGPVQNAVVALATLTTDLTTISSPLLNSILDARNLTTNAGSVLSNLGSQIATLTVDTQRIGVDTVAGVIGAAIGETLGSVFEFFAGGDILFPAHGSDANLTEQGIATHEYGHYSLCNLLDHVDASQFAVAYDEAAAQGLVTAQNPGATSSVLNESFADLIASQVAGGTDYAHPANSALSPTGLMSYCDATTSNCIETNQTNAPGQSFQVEVLRNVSMYTDAFDGETFPVPLDVPMNGNPWIAEPNVTSAVDIKLAGSPGSSAQDEVVSLSGVAFGAWIRHTLARSTLLREDNVFGGLSDAMIDQGVNWCARCQVFELHTNDSSTPPVPVCPTQWVGARPNLTVNGNLEPVSCAFEGNCPAGTTANPNTQMCEPGCPTGQSFDAFTLSCISIIIP